MGAAGTDLAAGPRTDPGVRHDRTALLPPVLGEKASVWMPGQHPGVGNPAVARWRRDEGDQVVLVLGVNEADGDNVILIIPPGAAKPIA